MNDTTSAPNDAGQAPEASQTTSAPQRRDRRGGRGRPAAKPQQQARAPRAVHPALQQLFDLYPKMFGAQFLPLKLGVFQDLLALHPELFKRDELKVALGLHARSMRYLESVAAGHPRHDLNGEPVEAVAPEHVHHAIMEVFRRRQMRTDQDLRPYARAQLIEAIEASGLSREDFLLCVRQQDEVSTALLDEAFAVLGEQAAKREALRKTFEASGKTVAEFADMYGMDPAEVTETLERAHLARVVQTAAAATPQSLPAESAPAEASAAP